MSLYGQYTEQIQDKVADISNVGARGRYGEKFYINAEIHVYTKFLCQNYIYIAIVPYAMLKLHVYHQ